MISFVKKKIHHIRKQPEPVRIGYAMGITAVGGLMLVIVWVTVLLPFQLNSGKKTSPDKVAHPITTSDVASPTPQVGGAQSYSNYYNPTATPTVVPTSSVTPTPATPENDQGSLPVASSAPEEDGELAPAENTQ